MTSYLFQRFIMLHIVWNARDGGDVLSEAACQVAHFCRCRRKRTAVGTPWY